MVDKDKKKKEKSKRYKIEVSEENGDYKNIDSKRISIEAPDIKEVKIYMIM